MNKIKQKIRENAGILSNSRFAKKDEEFIAWCEFVGIEPTKRQASKFRNRKGLAYNAYNYFLNGVTLITF